MSESNDNREASRHRSVWAEALPGSSFSTVSPRRPEGNAVSVDVTESAMRAAGFEASLAAAASSGRVLTVVVNDTHRPTDTRLFVDAFVRILDRAGLTATALPARVLVAAGTHGSSPAERAAHEDSVLGMHRPRFAATAWNDCDDASGRIVASGYAFHPWVADGGLAVACGSTEPHYFAGITGAHKTVTVGVLDRASIERNHSHAMEAAACGLLLAGNPVHEGIVEAVEALRTTGTEQLALNQLMVDGSAVQVFAGEPLAALEAAESSVRACFGRRLDCQVDVCVAQVEEPLSRDLYQADKGIKNTEIAVRDGGCLVLDAACNGGVGIDHFIELLRAAPTHDAAAGLVASRGYRLGDHKAVRLRALTDTRGVRLAIVSPNVDPSLEGVLGARIFSDRDSAAAWLAVEAPNCERALLVRDAGNVALEVG